jgi:hypothetical protein
MTSPIQSSLAASKPKRRRSLLVGASVGRAISPWRLSKRWTVAGASGTSSGIRPWVRAVLITNATL